MIAPTLVPPLKCQGIKTKLLPRLSGLVEGTHFERWVEPFCGSCVVALNVRPKRALLCDTNIHIIRLFQDIQAGHITPALVRSFLTDEGHKLSAQGEPYYYEVRTRFNQAPSSLDFIFLNRACFNGVMRFNRSGGFNVPYCHKSERFAQAYVTKIVNQVAAMRDVLQGRDWTFRVADFRTTLADVCATDFVYCDPPYAGRHTDYFNSWSTQDDEQLVGLLQRAPCPFLFSTWHSNEFRTNELIPKHWAGNAFTVHTQAHFYHVGSSEDLRHPMIEALIANYTTQEPESLSLQNPAQLVLGLA